MRVMLSVHSLRAGGAERVMAWLADVLVDRGHDVTLVLRMPQATDFYSVDPRVEIVRFVRPSGGLARDSRLAKAAGLRQFMAGLRGLARDQDTDVVVSFIDLNNFYVITALVGTGIPVVVSERIHPDWHELGRLARVRPALYRTATTVVVQTSDIERIATDQWKVSRTAVIPNPVVGQPAVIKPMGERPKRVVSVGRLTPQKDHASLLKAWAESASGQAGWNLEIFGYGSERESLLRTVDALGIAGSVDIREPVADIRRELQDCRIFILPSRYEGFPNALLEALSSGCACIATDCPGASAVVLDGGTCGILVAPGSVGQLAEAILALRDSDTEQDRLSNAAIARAYDFDEIKIADLWESALTRAASSGENDG